MAQTFSKILFKSPARSTRISLRDPKPRVLPGFNSHGHTAKVQAIQVAPLSRAFSTGPLIRYSKQWRSQLRNSNCLGKNKWHHNGFPDVRVSRLVKMNAVGRECRDARGVFGESRP